jgi:hypothetical protein
MFSAAKNQKQKNQNEKEQPDRRAATTTRPRRSVPLQQPAVPPPAPSTPNIFQSSDQSVDHLRVAYQGRNLTCELTAGRHPILTGSWEFEVLVDGRCIDSSNEADSAVWENNCWEENIDVSYSEMQLDLKSGIQIQRQMLLARRDRFAFLADVIVLPGDVAATYRCKLKLADQLVGQSAADVREVTLCRAPRSVARALPLSLPEWRRQPGGELNATDGLTMSQPIVGRRGHVAMFIDLDPRRLRRQLTWRQLTVAESLQIVPREVAAGYRVAEKMIEIL